MDVILGAWGLGSSISDSMVYAGDPIFSLSLPPMSSSSPGYVELFPFLLFDRVFMDERSYHFLCEKAVFGFQISKPAIDLLKDLENEGILILIDYGDELKNDVERIQLNALQLLKSDNLKNVHRTSRILWKNFLMSPGGEIHPNKVIELATTHDEISIIPKINDTLFHQKRTIKDALDISAMLILSEKLEAGICDWQMYGPLYDELIAITLAKFVGETPTNVNFLHEKLDLYIPVIEKPDPAFLFSVRESKLVSSFSQYTEFLRKNNNDFSFDQLLDLRKNLIANHDGAFLKLSVLPSFFNRQPVFFKEYIKKVTKDELEVYLSDIESNFTTLFEILRKLDLSIKDLSKKDIFEIKPGIAGVNIDIKELWKRISELLHEKEK